MAPRHLLAELRYCRAHRMNRRAMFALPNQKTNDNWQCVTLLVVSVVSNLGGGGHL